MSPSGTKSSVSDNRLSRLWRAARQEPLIHFLILAGLLFLAQAIWASGSREVIRVDAATQEFLIQQQSDLLLRPLSDEEEQLAITDYVEEEMLVREARKRGLDSSSRIRRLLVQNMRFFFAGDIGKPTDQELRAFFDENVDRFTSPPSLDLEQVYFSDPGAVPKTALTDLNAGADPAAFGDRSIGFGRRARSVTQSQLVGGFGPEGAKSILAIADQNWHGPIESPQGVHFLRVVTRNPPQRPSFEQATNWIETEWISAKHREIMDRELAKISADYRVELDPLEVDGGD